MKRFVVVALCHSAQHFGTDEQIDLHPVECPSLRQPRNLLWPTHRAPFDPVPFGEVCSEPP